MSRLLATLVFTVLITVDIVASAIVIVLLYLPFVALKAVALGLAGKVRIGGADLSSENHGNRRAGA